jgi:hypothetical protein
MLGGNSLYGGGYGAGYQESTYTRFVFCLSALYNNGFSCVWLNQGPWISTHNSCATCHLCVSPAVGVLVQLLTGTQVGPNYWLNTHCDAVL